MAQPRSWSMLCWVLALLLAACAPAATPTTQPATATPTTASRPGVTPAPVTTTPRPTPTPTPTSLPTPPAGPVYGGILRSAQGADPPGWDFHRLTGGANYMRDQSTMIFQQLFNILNTPQTGCSLVPQLELAESFRWVNDLTLEVTIRQGVKFHNKPPVNGRALTAEDMAYGLNRLVRVQGRVASSAVLIADIKARDARTLVISLKQPLADLTGESFLATTYGSYGLARESGGTDESWVDPAKSYIGTGAFMFQEYRPGLKVSYTRNPDYWKPGLPYVDGVEWAIMPDASTRSAALRTGKLDALNPYATNLPMVKELRSTASQIQATTCASWTGPFNYWRVDQPPLDDVRVRRALSMAIDREGLNRALLGGEGEVIAMQPSSASPLWLAPKDIPPEVRKYLEYRPEEARRLLAEAGYGAQKRLKVTLVHTQAHPIYWKQWTESVVSAWMDLGVDIGIKWQEYADYSRTAMAGNYADVATTGGAGGRGDIYALFASFLSTAPPPQNRSHVNDAAVDKLLQEFMATVDKGKQKELARQIQLRLIDQVYFLQSPVDPGISLRQPWVQNVGPMPSWFNSGSWVEIAWLKK